MTSLLYCQEGVQSNDIVPPEAPTANLRYRKILREWAADEKRGPANRRWIMHRSKRDFFWWLKSFGWLYEPRPEPGRAPILPFIPWPHQVPALQTLIDFSFPDGKDRTWQQKDVGIEKARGEGATWMCLMLITWRWLFHDMEAFGLVSRKEEAADSPDDPDSLGTKIDWALSKMPQWMTGIKGKDYRRNISKHTWFRTPSCEFGKGCSITAYASTGDLASGGRKTLFFMDELSKFARGEDELAMAATEPVTNCRWLVSTYNGANGAYYQAMVNADNLLMEVIKLRWWDNPYRSKGLFLIDGAHRRLLDGRTKEPIDPAELPQGYEHRFFTELFQMLQKRGFVPSDSARLLRKLWSPWYVDRCLRPGMTPPHIAQEYDMDPIGSGNRFFPAELLAELGEHCTDPVFCGDLEYNLETLEITRIFRSATGLFRTWLPTEGGRWRPPAASYIVGADVAQGLGTDFSSNSALCVLNRDTGQKVAEFASPTVLPEQLAEMSIALCRFFAGPNNEPAYLIWEGNGPGGLFRERVMSSNFRNVYYRNQYKTRKGKPSKEMGWWSSVGAKNDLMGKYRWALQEGFFKNPSSIALREAGQYTTVAGGRLEFVPTTATEVDPSDAGEAHGDRCIADAVANFAMEYLGGGATLSSQREKKGRLSRVKDGSFLQRQMEFRKKKRQTAGNLDW